MSAFGLLVFYSLCGLLASLAGGWVFLFIRPTHRRLQMAISFVAGFMLGVGVLHMVPHAWHEIESIDRVTQWLLAGFVMMFIVQRFFHFHHHDVSDERFDGHGPSEAEAGEAGHQAHGHAHALAEISASRLSWGGAALGLTLHALIDGIAIAAAVEADAKAGGSGLLGLGTFLVVVLHKPFDALAVGTLMAASGSSRYSRHLVNGLFALVIPVGVCLFHFGAVQFGPDPHAFVGAALAFAGGTFVCIAASDLLPELQFHSHDRVKLSVALLIGLLLAAAIGGMEVSGHDRHEVDRVEQRLGMD